MQYQGLNVLFSLDVGVLQFYGDPVVIVLLLFGLSCGGWACCIVFQSVVVRQVSLPSIKVLDSVESSFSVFGSREVFALWPLFASFWKICAK